MVDTTKNAEKHTDNIKAIPLSLLDEQQEATVIAIEGGHMMQGRLARLGIIPNSNIKMIKKAGKGPIIIEVKGTRFAIGRGMISRIMVTHNENKTT